ncbi:hypothetical protein [Ligilactobacillus apodemi]|nr:hypothetical protein [Ligilactobacillus apodemi]
MKFGVAVSYLENITDNIFENQDEILKYINEHSEDETAKTAFNVYLNGIKNQKNQQKKPRRFFTWKAEDISTGKMISTETLDDLSNKINSSKSSISRCYYENIYVNGQYKITRTERKPSFSSTHEFIWIADNNYTNEHFETESCYELAKMLDLSVSSVVNLRKMGKASKKGYVISRIKKA